LHYMFEYVTMHKNFTRVLLFLGPQGFSPICILENTAERGRATR